MNVGWCRQEMFCYFLGRYQESNPGPLVYKARSLMPLLFQDPIGTIMVIISLSVEQLIKVPNYSNLTLKAKLFMAQLTQIQLA